MKYSLLFLLFFALNKSSKAQKFAFDTTFMQTYCASNYEQIDGFFDKGKTPARITANKKTLVYAFPDLLAKRIDTLETFMQVTYLQEGSKPNTKENWVKISYNFRDNQGVYRENQGYIIEQNMSFGSVNDNSEDRNLSFILTESPLLDIDLKMPRFRLNAIDLFKDLDYHKVKNVITYDLKIGAINYYNHFYLAAVSNNALKNMPNLSRLYWHHGESCPESEGQVFIAYANGKMSEIISSSSTGEGVFYESTKVYLPVKFAKGKVLLVENGDSENMLDSYTGTLKTIPYPQDCGVPIEQLVTVIEEDAEAKEDAKGEYILNKDHENIMEITHKIIKYYRWDGTKLQQTKRVVIKQRKEN